MKPKYEFLLQMAPMCDDSEDLSSHTAFLVPSTKTVGRLSKSPGLMDVYSIRLCNAKNLRIIQFKKLKSQ